MIRATLYVINISKLFSSLTIITSKKKKIKKRGRNLTESKFHKFLIKCLKIKIKKKERESPYLLKVVLTNDCIYCETFQLPSFLI